MPDPTAGARTVCPKVVDTIRINSCKSQPGFCTQSSVFCLVCSDVHSTLVSCTCAVGTCIKSEVHAYQGTTALNTPVFVSSDDQVRCGNLMHCLSRVVTVVACLQPALTLEHAQVYLSIQLNMTWAEIFANPPNITLILGARPGVRKCNWWQQPIKGEQLMWPACLTASL